MPDNYRRTRPDSKCPACGWRIDPDAYRCPKCLIYFCYKCRKRVQKGDAQFQCVNQTCACHGKLLCAACTVMVPEFADVTRQVVTRGKIVPGKPPIYGWGLLIAAGVAFFVAGNFVNHPLPALLISAAVFAIGAFFLPRPLGGAPEIRDPDTYQQVTEREQTEVHRCCIQCRTPTEFLR